MAYPLPALYDRLATGWGAASMKGIVFNLLDQVVTAEHGEDLWDSLLERAGVQGAYTAVGNYPDAEMDALVEAASGATGASTDDILLWFGERALPLFAARYPRFFEGHTTARSFVLTLNEVIHPEVRKLFPGAYAPDFTFAEHDDGRLELGYVSERKLCSFAEGLLTGAANYFGETVTIEQSLCQKRGDRTCVMVCRFGPAP